MNDRTARSYLSMIGAMLIFGTIGVFRRFIPLSSGLLAFTRGLLGSGFLCALIKLRGGRIRHGIGTKNVLLLALTGGLIGINWMLLFEAYRYTTVAVATLCYYMAPTLVILLSPIFFRERLTLKKLVCALLAVIGLALVSGITDGSGLGGSDLQGIACALGAALLYATVVILNKRVQVEDAYERTIIQLLFASIVLIPYLLLTEHPGDIVLDAVAVIMILIAGIVHTGIAYALYFGSMAGLKAQSVAILSYIDPVSALILSALILHEHMSVISMVGAVLIIGSALVSELTVDR